MTATLEQLVSGAEYRKAVDLCESVQLDGDLPSKFWFLKAAALEGLGENGRAIDAYRCEIASVRRVPPDILGQVGALLSGAGRFREAALCLEESCQLTPSADRLILLAAALFRSGRADRARDKLRMALNIQPDNDEAWNNLGAYSLAESPAGAEAAFRRALSIDSRRTDSYVGVGMSCLRQGRASEAIEAAGEGLKIKPLDGLCHIVIGEAKEMLADLEGAERAFFSAYRCDGDRPSGLLGLARVLERQGNPSEALSWYGRGLRAWPDDGRIRDAYRAFASRLSHVDAKLSELCQRLDRADRDLKG